MVKPFTTADVGFTKTILCQKIRLKESDMPKISMTGSRTINTLTQKQLVNFRQLMIEYRDKGYTHLNHGDCQGADEIAHEIAIELGLEIVIYPPDKTKYRANCKGENVTIRPEASYRSRNQAIVNNGHVLLALPNSNCEQLRSGTWMTVRMARKANLPMMICYPDGRILKENFGGLFEDE